ncbi:Prophage CP4-57 regulatory protein (AlpA) [Pigmentiphaga humi]|uniref:Prophage CP4-57 regulatory protein (AlpA) n=1 Tax=Pigmentiphaga humi TaxID=2478468 RepID=A0A3P4B4K1_9BURK|nr:AlpA family phage regulatory protein [Pigmentiphaga humi]VCU70851.1 Prophage CP4-57 regulatory protein (AlpA) [Pigmentiphaga humi]
MNALKIKDVLKKVSLGQSTVYKMIAEDKFPKPFRISDNRVAWSEEEIDA